MTESSRSTEKREHWETVLREQEESGLSGAAFCREKGIGYQTFISWRKRLGRTTRSRTEAVFQELCSASFNQSCCLEIVLGAITVRVHQGFDSVDLQRALQAVVSLPVC